MSETAETPSVPKDLELGSFLGSFADWVVFDFFWVVFWVIFNLTGKVTGKVERYG
jgi:hypothetical protein